MSLSRSLRSTIPKSLLSSVTSLSRSTSIRFPVTRRIHTTTRMSAAVEPGHPPRNKSAARIPGPVETSMQTKLVEAFQPTLIRISNDSSKHAHHTAMRAIGGGGGETHFAVAIVSSSFTSKTAIQRHRMVNNLLKDEFDNMGLHALSLRLKTPEEWEKEIDAATASGVGRS